MHRDAAPCTPSLARMRLPFFRSRASRRDYAFGLRTGTAEPLAPAPPSQPRELIDVIGIGATEMVGGVALTLLSVERYREGHVALFRMFRHRERSERELPMPHFELAITPESSTPYRFWMMGGTGGGGVAGEMEYRQAYAIAPAPPSDGSEIVIEVREISWERLGAGTRKVVAVDTGPWRFSISIEATA
jgi:hypothetical protein